MTMRSATTRRSLCFVLLAAASVPSASAQLLAAKDGPVVYGHHHLNVTSIDEHMKFWSTLGGRPVKVGTSPNEIVMFPNVLVFLRQQAPTGGTKGTTVNHLAFAVTNLRQAVDTAKAAGYRIATREEAGAYDEVKDDIAFNKEQQSYSALSWGLTRSRCSCPPRPLRGAGGGDEGTAAPVVGTRGRVVDHIGFEVRDLEAFCKKLEGMIELTDGLDKVRCSVPSPCPRKN
jgi:hypothetical protein